MSREVSPPSAGRSVLVADDRMFDLLYDTVASALDAKDLDGVLAAIMRNLRKELAIWSAWVAVITPEMSAKVLAASSAYETRFLPETVVSFGITPTAKAYFAACASGKIVIHHQADGTFGIIDEVLLKEGTRNLVLLPIQEEGALVALLVIACADEGSIEQMHVPFFESVSKGVERHVVDLIRTAGMVEGTVMEVARANPPRAQSASDLTADSGPALVRHKGTNGSVDDRLFDLFHDSVADVLAARDLDDVLDAIMKNLQSQLTLWTSWIAVLMPEGTVKFVAVSANLETLFQVGTQVAVDITEQAVKYFAATAAGRIVIHSSSDGTLGALDEAMLREGVQSAAYLPLLDGRRLAAYLVIATAIDEGIRPVHKPFLEGLSRGTERHILELIRKSGHAEGSVL